MQNPDSLIPGRLAVESAALRSKGVVYTLPRPARHSDVMRNMADRLVPRLEVLSGGKLTSEEVW